MLQHNYKVKVTPENSEKLQTELFKNGYKWLNGNIVVSYVDAAFLFITTVESGYSYITYTDSIIHYNNKIDYIEITFEDLMPLLMPNSTITEIERILSATSLRKHLPLTNTIAFLVDYYERNKHNS